MIKNLCDRADGFLGRVRSKYESRLPFNGLFLDLAAGFVRQHCDKLRLVLEDLMKPDGDYDHAVDVLVWFLKNGLKLPKYLFFLRPFIGVYADQLGKYLKDNRVNLRDVVIADSRPE